MNMAGSPSFTERRASARHALDVPVEFPGGGGRVLDIGSGGLCMVTAARFAVGDAVPMRASFEPRRHGEETIRVCLAATVVRVRPARGPRRELEVAVRFESLCFGEP